jgi:splicing factor 3B subunit 2
MPDNSPPPWLVNMQRHGPPPAFPSLKIPGLNAPLPPGASFGFHAGGWGKPPVDAYGRPLYGDVFGKGEAEEAGFVYAGDGMVVKKEPWGGRPEGGDESDSESEEEDEDEDEEGGEEEEGGGEEASKDGTASVATTAADGFNSVATADLNLRKDGTETEEAPQLYTVLKEKSRKAGEGGEIFGSSTTYVLPGQSGGADSVATAGDESIISKRGSDKRKRDDDDDEDDDEEAAKKYKF